jgi:hypothetical protein
MTGFDAKDWRACRCAHTSDGPGSPPARAWFPLGPMLWHDGWYKPDVAPVAPDPRLPPIQQVLGPARCSVCNRVYNFGGCVYHPNAGVIRRMRIET